MYLFLCSSYIVFSQEFQQSFYPDGTLRSEGNMRNGAPDGLWKSYYPSGTIRSVGVWKDASLDSTWSFYDEEGNLKEQITYFEKQKNGIHIEYSTKEGLTYPLRKVMYVKNEKQGIEQVFSPDGAVLQEIPYENGKKQGRGYEYADTIVTTINIFDNDVLLSSMSVNRKDSLGNKTGLYVEFYPNGSIKSEANYQDGMLNGVYKMYNRHEQLEQVGNYAHDSILYSSSTMADFEDPQERREYYPDSALRSKGAFKNGIPIGVHRQYAHDGTITGGELYDVNGIHLGTGVTLENGEKNGYWVFLNNSGSMDSDGSFSNGLQTGIWKYYYPNGRLKQTGTYVKGRYTGTWTFYNESGDVQRVEEFKGGVRDGLCVEYDDEGQIILEGMYKNGLRDGNWTISQGELIEEGEYNHGEKNGPWKSSYLDGAKAFKGEFQSDKPHGWHVYYYKNGQIEREGRYRHGEKVKTWKYYNEDGHLMYYEVYKGGKTYSVFVPIK